MMSFNGTRSPSPYTFKPVLSRTRCNGPHRRHLPRTCTACGHPAPLDAIRLSGGRFYCPQGACRQEAERLIREAQGRLTAAAVADR